MLRYSAEVKRDEYTRSFEGIKNTFFRRVVSGIRQFLCKGNRVHVPVNGLGKVVLSLVTITWKIMDIAMNQFTVVISLPTMMNYSRFLELND